MVKNMRYTLNIRLFGEQKCFGPGIAELLRQVRALHSLRGAAAEMGMAYSKAWRIVRETEAALGFDLLDSQTGGAGGGGATLTPPGADMLERYDAFVAEVCAAADAAFEKRFGEE